MTCDDCRWAAAYPVAAAEFDDEGHAKCRAKGQGRCTCQHRGTPYAINVDKDVRPVVVHVHVDNPSLRDHVEIDRLLRKAARALRAGFQRRS